MRAGTVAVALALCACDWEQFALLNGIPLRGDPADNPVVRVYLGLDGAAYSALADARAQGAFADETWRAAPFIAMFPATSDASWSRILRSKVRGYEYQHYDPNQDAIVNNGYLGLLKHALPAFESRGSDAPDYYEHFDYYANGYLNSYWNYQETDLSYAESLDGLFYLLEGYAETRDVVTAYFLELDALGHMQTRAQTVEALLSLGRRIKQFKRHHPERQFMFTLYSDHGMDFIKAAPQELVRFSDELRSVDVEPVESFAQGRATQRIFAVPIIHTRVSYLGLHTEKTMAAEVAQRASLSPTIDLAVAALGEAAGLAWLGVWRNGNELARFGYDRANDAYTLRGDALALDLDLPLDTPLSDEAVFTASASGSYPDLLYRVRTAFEPVSVDFPPQVLVSFKRPFASMGFEIPGEANEIASEGFHGGLDAGGSMGMLLTEERDLPPAVRSDMFLDLFPQLRDHLAARALGIEPPADGHLLDL